MFVCFRLPLWPVSGCDVCLFVSDCRCGQSLVVMFVCLFVCLSLFVCLFVSDCRCGQSGCDVCLFVCLFVSDCRCGQSLVEMFVCLFVTVIVCLFQIAAVASLWL